MNDGLGDGDWIGWGMGWWVVVIVVVAMVGGVFNCNGNGALWLNGSGVVRYAAKWCGTAVVVCLLAPFATVWKEEGEWDVFFV